MRTRQRTSGRTWFRPFILALLLLCSASLASAQRVILLGSGTDPKISGDGKWVVFSQDPLHTLVRADGAGATLLPEGSPAKQLNFDGTRMVYERYGFPSGVGLLDLTTMQTTVIATDPYYVEMPTISADGGTVVFWDSNLRLRAVNADGSNDRFLDDGYYSRDQGGPALTADGTMAVFAAGYPTGLNSSNPYAVATDSNLPVPVVLDDGKEVLRVRISDDGTRITFEDYNAGLYMADTDGTNFRTLYGSTMNFWGEGHDYSALSGTGEIAVFSSYNRVFVARTDGTALMQIGGGGGEVDINARGDVVVFSGSAGGMSGILAVGVPWVSPSEVGPISFDVNGSDLSWVGSASASAYNLYRSPLSALSSGIAGDCLQGGLTTESATDTDIPSPGMGYAYIVTGENAAGNGETGLRSDGVPRVLGAPCTPIDFDGDGTPDAVDVCPMTPDPLQEDLDGDGVGDACDNCVIASNPDQTDSNNDGEGDVCYCHASNNPGSPDADGDQAIDACPGGACYPFVIGSCDNCPSTYNPDQAWVEAPIVQVTAPAGGGGPGEDIGTNLAIEWAATDDCGGVRFVDIFISRTGAAGPFEPIVQGISNSGSYVWNITGPATSHGDAFIRVTARDAGNNEATDMNDQGFTIK